MATIGLDSLYYSKITTDSNGIENYGTPIKLAKAIDAELAIELLEAILYADDGTDTVIKEFKSGTLTLGIDDIGTQTAQDLTGAVKDANSVLIAAGEDEPLPVAIGFRAKSANGRYRYFWLYKVLFGIPGATLKTKGDSIEFNTPTVEGAITRRNKPDAAGKHPWKAEVTEGAVGVNPAIITDWFNSVYEPEYTVPDATLASLTPGAIAISPTFSSEVAEYTATTENATNTITAVAKVSGAAIAITVNGHSISNGQSATWEMGINTVVIIVTNISATKTYTIVVTKGE